VCILGIDELIGNRGVASGSAGIGITEIIYCPYAPAFSTICAYSAMCRLGRRATETYTAASFLHWIRGLQGRPVPGTSTRRRRMRPVGHS
jgi:hypothetical protein